MSRRPAAIAFLATSLALCACDQARAPRVPGVAREAPAFDSARLESAIDRRFGGVGTCVIIEETGSGATAYQYGSHTLCRTPLPPCATFDIASALIGLDVGAATPKTVFKWDGSPQPVSAWERDTDLATAFSQSIGWWMAELARKVGAQAYARRLRELDYGNGRPDGPIGSFWMGPGAGGGLTITTGQQADFLRRLFADRLPVKPATAATVRELMVEEGAPVSDKFASCASNAEGSRQVGWWVGRLRTPKNDYVFAASMEGANDNVLPGRELQVRGKAAFAAAGLLPSA